MTTSQSKTATRKDGDGWLALMRPLLSLLTLPPGQLPQFCRRAPVVNGFVLSHAYFRRISSCADFVRRRLARPPSSACMRNADGLRGRRWIKLAVAASGGDVRHHALAGLNVRNFPIPCSCCSRAGWSGVRSSPNFQREQAGVRQPNKLGTVIPNVDLAPHQHS